ncbi:MAG: hypothetical protein B7Z71_01935 [Acidocella sp. 21-58-7]|nr:MAG: hypothetical protein B7Z71_01935 [Acidocella sp. 21-58-7]HQT62971.1 outer membrane beta-barrel protein [Acidocella sp.]
MITMRRQLLGLGFVAASSLLALNAAQAMSGPTAIQIDGGPLGALQLSGGVDGYGYYVNPVGHGISNGANVANGLVELQKTDGELQFTVEVGSNGGAITPGASNTHPGQTSITTFVTGPLYAGYVTLAPTALPGFTISAGQIASLEGYESGVDWNNPSQLTTALFFVQNSQSRGVTATYATGPVSATVTFGDGFDTGVFNVLQGLVSYTINSNNVLNVYGEANLGTTGPNAFLYGNGTVGLNDGYINSNMIGAYYSYTNGNLNLVPEVQFQYAKKNAKAGIYSGTTDFGAALLGTYTFGTSPYSIGGWAEYYTSHTGYIDNYSQFGGPDAQAIGLAVSPTWQYKDLFARANAGYVYLLHNTDALGGKFGFGSKSTDRGQFTATLEAGILF